MIQVRNSGGFYAWALVFTGLGFAASLVLAIVFYTRVEEARQNEEKAQTELQRVISTEQQSSSQLAELRGQLGQAEHAGKTLVGLLIERDQQHRSRGTSLQAERDVARGELASQTRALEQARGALTAAQAATEASNKEKQALADRFAQAQQQLDQRLNQLAQEAGGIQTRLTSATTELQGRVQTVRSESQTQLADQVRQIEQMTQEVAMLRQRIAELESDRRKAGLNALTEADAHIVAVYSELGTLYIDRGLRDRLPLGTTFEVFPRDVIVDVTNWEESRGKATVQVIDLDDRGATCRVVRREAGALLQVGDQLINLAYDPNHQVRLHIYGDFDLENQSLAGDHVFGRRYTDAEDDPGLQSVRGDDERARNLVRQWGGVVTDTLTYEVDYLVLGIQPVLPREPDAHETNPDVIRAHIEAREKYLAYQSLVATAKDLGIPVLNQNRFQQLIGYYRR